MTKSDTWMPLYIGDYLADTMHLTGVEHGAYLLLIMHYWRTGPLPDDDRKLAAIARTGKKEWGSGVGETVRAFFHVVEGQLHHKRIDTELATAEQMTAQRSAAGKASAASKALKREAQREVNDRSTTVENPFDFRATPSPSPSPSPSSSLRSEEFSEVRTSAPVKPDAQQNPPDENLENPQKSAPLPSEPLDIRTEFWTEGLAVFRRITGKTEGPSRAFLGRMVRDLGDDCAAGLAILRQAEADRPGDPMAWLAAAVRARDKPRETHAQRQNRAVLDALGIAHGAAP